MTISNYFFIFTFAPFSSLIVFCYLYQLTYYIMLLCYLFCYFFAGHKTPQNAISLTEQGTIALINYTKLHKYTKSEYTATRTIAHTEEGLPKKTVCATKLFYE